MKQSDDIKVFEFINSKNCITYFDLTKFLYDNKLPYNERWVFYFFGKSKFIDQEVINEMAKKGRDSYGGYVFGEIYYWQEYLKREDEIEYLEFLRNELKEEGKYATQQEVRELFIKLGYEYVHSSVQNDSDSIANKLIRQHEEMRRYSEPNNERNICEVCNESPCMCSDREQTSTLNDF